ncbi:MAG: type III pantothenate kinase [Clostridia bacterium]|nr:type III pantothenate kinase [Clostridia bacterium]
MFLAIDVGNTNIVLGVFDGEKLISSSRVFTRKDALADEYSVLLNDLFRLDGIDPSEIDGCVISSVVPKLTDRLVEAVEKIASCKPVVVAAGLKTGINIMIDNPAQLGSDMVANAAGAVSRYQLPVIIIDLGTAMTFSVVDETRTFLGGVITAGVRTSLDALTERTSQLPDINVEAPASVIGKNTVDSMKSGVVFGAASLIDGMIDRISEEKERTFTVVATGGMSKYIVPHCRNKIAIDTDLMLYGLLEIHKRNS